MLMIRLQRTGRKHVPSFRVVLTDKRNSTKSGRTLEKLGSYNPTNDKEKNLNVERIKYWLSKGAQLSGTLHNYLIEQKIITGKKINVLPKKRPIKPTSTEVSEKETEEKKEEVAPTETPAEEVKETKEKKPEEKSEKAAAPAETATEPEGEKNKF